MNPKHYEQLEQIARHKARETGEIHHIADVDYEEGRRAYILSESEIDSAEWIAFEPQISATFYPDGTADQFVQLDTLTPPPRRTLFRAVMYEGDQTTTGRMTEDYGAASEELGDGPGHIEQLTPGIGWTVAIEEEL